jgi:antitoxin ParD1/3/4
MVEENLMPTRNIHLTERFDRFIATEVKSGRYGNASEVVREGLRLVERRNCEEQAKLKWLRGAVKTGIEELDRGEGIEVGSLSELHREIARLNGVASKRQRA